MNPHSPSIWHLVIELIAYFVGSQLYWQRRKHFIPLQQDAGLWIAFAGIFGAALGAKVIYWLEYAPYIAAHWRDWQVWLGGKTIVGGLLGAWLGVEGAKKYLGILVSTGDFFVLPLTVGIAIGRIGCLLTGLEDHTYGSPTFQAWGWDFGDGILRHPLPLYEIIYLIVLSSILWGIRRNLRQGEAFKLFMAGYLSFRLFADWWKPPFHGAPHSVLEANMPLAYAYFGVLTGIQLSCLLVLLFVLVQPCWRILNRLVFK